jgi:hypothetical protein
MPRGAVISLGVFLALVGALGLRLGWLAATLDESALIDRYAAAYVAGGGVRSECHAEPGAGPLARLRVVCAPPDRPGARHVWTVAPWGQLLSVDRPGDGGGDAA